MMKLWPNWAFKDVTTVKYGLFEGTVSTKRRVTDFSYLANYFRKEASSREQNYVTSGTKTMSEKEKKLHFQTVVDVVVDVARPPARCRRLGLRGRGAQKCINKFGWLTGPMIQIAFLLSLSSCFGAKLQTEDILPARTNTHERLF